MEQHNIDKRFKDNLGNISRQPSPDAWARLQAQMEPVHVKEEKKRSGFWLYIAAAVTLLLASVATWQFSFNPDQGSQQLATVTTKSQEKTTVKPADYSSEVKAKTETALPERMLAQNGNQNEVKTETTAPQTTTVIAKKGIKKKSLVNQPEIAPETLPALPETGSEAALLASNNPVIKRAKDKKAPAPSPSTITIPAEQSLMAAAQPAKAPAGSEEVFDLNGQPVIVVVKKSGGAPAAVAPQALAVNTPAPAAEERDPVKLKNIFKQARNLKNGESVNLQDLGLTASSKLAVETRNIQEKFSKVLDL